MTQGSANYKAAGVDYDALGEGKRMAMARALATSPPRRCWQHAAERRSTHRAASRRSRSTSTAARSRS
jgi:hypothetical protein